MIEAEHIEIKAYAKYADIFSIKVPLETYKTLSY